MKTLGYHITKVLAMHSRAAFRILLYKFFCHDKYILTYHFQCKYLYGTSDGEVHFNWLIAGLSQESQPSSSRSLLKPGEIMKICLYLNLAEAMMGAVAKNTIGLWLNITGECSSASLAGSHLTFDL